MPTKILDIGAAFQNVRSNRHGAWGKGASSREPGTDPNCASARVHSSNIRLGLRPPARKLKPGGSIFAMGSCFAREIEAALAPQGFEILSRPQGDRTVSGYRHEGRSELELLNRYNTASMLLEFRRILEDKACVPDDALVIPHSDKNYLEAHYHSIGAATLEEIAQRRARFWQDFQSIRTADAIFITLGVNEAPFDTECGLYRNVSPLVFEMRRRKGIEIHVLSVAENVRYLEEIRRIIRAECDSEALLFVTVSPVPLTSTYTSDDVVIANAASKATLRAAAAEFCSLNQDVIYFPSYEMAMHSDPAAVYMGDKRHIRKPFVSNIISQFVETHVEPDSVTAEEASAGVEPA